MTEEVVASAGVHLCVRRYGQNSGPTVILLHGFPDNQTVWEPVIEHLENDFQVISYDVRGAGRSSAPRSRSGFEMSRLIDDLVAVIERVEPYGDPVHLVGHDWGSVQMWEAVLSESADARLNGRIATYTSISGPALELFGRFFTTGLRALRLATVARQLARSWYILALQVPVVPEFVFRHFGQRIKATLSKSQQLDESAHWSSDTFVSDAIHGMNLYRTNRLRFRKRSTNVPVQLIIPREDAFLSPEIYSNVNDFSGSVHRVEVAAGHWVIRTHPEMIADHISAFVSAGH